MSRYDPSIPKFGENQTTMAETESQVSLAYGVAITELDTLLNLVRLVEPPPAEDANALERYRDLVFQDIGRLAKKLNSSKRYLKARDAQFHYRAKRLRTNDRVDRLRLWNREKKQELEACRLQSGDIGYQTAQHRFEEEKRVMIKCYGLERLWERAMKRERLSKIEGDDLSSGCETSMEE
ncbi:hypothetical protein B0J13DRAFT_146126 [Dactylonectria estremocensis]|uniref:Uncharacterized protein n=1 Tax=Dactylonectria estremocensis TaxID=1079267 RepID=A0A9P9DW23_9HYPO|nr:hypothetical protein B0J13DRAFT_146126 [Dactylonectria estremocensis]